jgi:hypothetical protein
LSQSLDAGQNLAFAFRIPDGLGRAGLLLGDEADCLQPFGQQADHVVVHLVETLA